MNSQENESHASPDVRAVVLDDGEEAFASLQAFARENGISAASPTAVGAFKGAKRLARPLSVATAAGSSSSGIVRSARPRA